MKKLLVAFIIALFIFSLVNASSLKKPEWRKGDFWKYEMETIGGKNKSIISTTIIGKEDVTINNITYHCIVSKNNFSGEIRVQYLDEESLAIVKEIIYNNGAKEKIYNPPSSLIQYPVFIGKKWETNTNWKNTTITIFFECIGKKDITTKAGKFSCYVIRANYSFNGTISPYFYQVIYVSGRAGNIVRVEYYGNMEGNETLVEYIELVSFRYSADIKHDNLIIYGIVIGGIIISLLALYKQLGVKKKLL